MISVKRGDEVTVQLRQGKPLEIAVVASAGPALIELTDGRLYFASDGRSIRSPQFARIVPATKTHRTALMAKETIA
jgi:hypothetical protein